MHLGNLIFKITGRIFSTSIFLLLGLNLFSQSKKKTSSTKTVVKPVVKKLNNFEIDYKLLPKEYTAMTSYSVSASGDTINILDSEKRKQGWWVEEASVSKIIEGVRNVFVGAYWNNMKVGKWQNYEGKQLMLEENYRLGLKDGEYKIFEDGKISIHGNYLAVNKAKEYDTLEIEDFDGAFITKIVKTDRGSYKQGEWTYYYPNSIKVMRKEYYVLDDLVDTKEFDLYDSTQVQKLKDYRANTKNPAPVWTPSKKNEVVRYSDINPDGKGVKPNVRTKPKQKKH